MRLASWMTLPRIGTDWPTRAYRIEAFKAKYEGNGKKFEKSDWDQLLGHCMVRLSCG